MTHTEHTPRFLRLAWIAFLYGPIDPSAFGFGDYRIAWEGVAYWRYAWKRGFLSIRKLPPCTCPDRGALR
jgi:hypothetical protein